MINEELESCRFIPAVWRCIRLCPIVACLRALCQLCVKRTQPCVYVCVTRSVCSLSGNVYGTQPATETRVEEVRSDWCAGGGGLRAFPRGERATTETCASLPSACVPARSLTRFWWIRMVNYWSAAACACGKTARDYNAPIHASY